MRKEHLSAYALKNYVAKKTKGQPRGPRKGASSMVKLIKKVSTQQTLRELETKLVTTSQGGVTFNGVIASGFNEMYSLIPPVSPPSLVTEAAQDFQRANNDITPMMCKTTWHITLTPTARAMNIVAVLYCLQAKSIRYYPELANVFPAASGTHPAFLKNGIATQTTIFDGLPVHGDIPINIEEFTLLHKKKFHLTKNVGLPNADTSTGNAPNVGSLNSYREHTYHLKVPKQYRYAPGGANVYPDGHAPFWVIGYFHTDGSAADTVNRDVTVSWTTQMSFKDA